MSVYRSDVLDTIYYIKSGCKARRKCWHKDSFIYMDKDKDIIIKVRMGKEVPWRPKQDDIRSSDWGFIICAPK